MKHYENLVGQVFDRLTIIEKTNIRKDKSVVWRCKCICGNEHFVNTKHLKKGAVRSCGCLMHEPNNRAKNMIREDLSGKVYGLLTVIKYVYTESHQRTWECLCECGNTVFVSTNGLNSKHTQSCGCRSYKSGRRKGSDIYNYSGYKDITGTKWNSLIQGAKTRNIKVEITKKDAWDVFESQNYLCNLTGLPISFKNKTASIDRIDSSKNYILDNIQIVHKDVNRMKSNFDENYFIGLCKLISDNKQAIK